ncbi:MAG: ComEC family competence protein [Oscillospiraceae bacterium]|jgi:competence protein ComEC|nr:ComEC family competence protein [Oscillospiraceae bacterium]
MFFVIPGFSYLMGQVFAIYFGPIVAIYSTVFLLFVFLIKYKRFKPFKTVSLAILMFSCSVFVHIFYFSLKVNSLKDFSEKKLEISGVVCELPIRENDKFNYILNADKIKVLGDIKQNKIKRSENDKNCSNENFLNLKVKIISNKDLQIDAYDKITLKANSYEISTQETLFSKNEMSKGIFLLCSVNSFEEIVIFSTSNPPAHYYLLKIKKTISQALKILLPLKHASVVCSFLLGEKTDLSPEIRSCFSDSGISHLLAISGAHMAIISKFSLMFFDIFRIKKKWAYIATVLSVLLFMGLTGFVLSAVRSGIMCIIYIVGLILHRKSNSLNSLGFSVFIISVFNPFAGGDIGFLMSVLATLGIILISSQIESYLLTFFSKIIFARSQISINSKKEIKLQTPPKNSSKKIYLKFQKGLNLKFFLNRIFKFCVSTTSVSISAVLFNLPILLFCFEKFSVLFILTNVLVGFSFAAIISFAILSVLFYFIGPLSFLCKPLVFICGVSINHLLFCASFVSRIPFSVIPTNKLIFTFTWASFAILFSISLIFWENKHLLKLSSIFSLIILLTSILSYQILTSNLISFSILDTGDGYVISISKNHRYAILCSSKGKFIKRSGLSSDKIKNLDLFVPQNESRINAKFLGKILSEKNSTNILLHKRDYECENKDGVKYYSSDARIKIWNDLEVRPLILFDKIWIYLKINNSTLLLCPEDASPNDIPTWLCNCDFVILNKAPKNLNRINAKCVITRSAEDCNNDSRRFSPKNRVVKINKFEKIRIEFYSKNISLSVHKNFFENNI